MDLGPQLTVRSGSDPDAWMPKKAFASARLREAAARTALARRRVVALGGNPRVSGRTDA